MSETTMYSNKADDFKSVKLGEIAEIEMGQSPDSAYVSDDPFNGLPFLQGNAEFGSVSPTPKYGCTQPAKVASKNDVLISVRAPVGDVNIADKAYCIGRGLAAISIENIKPSLAAYLISQNTAALRRVAQGTTFEAINKSDLQNLEILVPPETELPVIAEFLDALDTTIQQSVTIIAKLKSVKQGLLHDLLTRGIDASGQLRPPQDEAPHLYKESPLGWIPKEWQVVFLSEALTGIDAGKSPSCPDMPAPSGRWGVLKVSAVHPDGFKSDQNKVVENSSFINPAYEVQPDDLLITRANTPELVGLVCLVDLPQPKLMLCDKTLRLNVEENKFSKEFIFYCLQQPYVRTQIELSATGTSMSMKNISQSAIKNLMLAIAPLHEQAEITDKAKALSNKIQQEVAYSEKLQRQKLALMDDLLTGRVSVTPLLQKEAELCASQ